MSKSEPRLEDESHTKRMRDKHIVPMLKEQGFSDFEYYEDTRTEEDMIYKCDLSAIKNGRRYYFALRCQRRNYARYRSTTFRIKRIDVDGVVFYVDCEFTTIPTLLCDPNIRIKPDYFIQLYADENGMDLLIWIDTYLIKYLKDNELLFSRDGILKYNHAKNNENGNTEHFCYVTLEDIKLHFPSKLIKYVDNMR